MTTKADIFDITFDALQKSLKYDLLSKTSLNSERTDEIKASSTNNRLLDIKLHNILISDIMSKTLNYKDDIKRIRKLVFNKYQNLLKLKTNSIHQIIGSHRLNIMICNQYENIIHKRLNNQKLNSEKRIQDLVFEVIGEYGKSNIRIVRRQDYLRKTGRTKVIISIWKLQWQKFGLRLKYDLEDFIINDRCLKDSSQYVSYHNFLQQYIQCVHLTPESNADELELVLAKISKKIGLLSDKKYTVQSVVKISKNGRDKAINSANTNATTSTINTSTTNGKGNLIQMATSMKEMQSMLHVLKDWIKKNNPVYNNNAFQTSHSTNRARTAGSSRHSTISLDSNNNNNNTIPLIKEFLRISHIEWIHPGSFLPIWWDSVYRDQYCQQSSSNSNNNSASKNTTMNESDTFSTFARRYYAQHTCTIFNERLYYCLEERSLRSSSSNSTIESYSNNSNPVFNLDTDQTKENQRAMLENDITIKLLVVLQEIYVDHPYVHVAHAHSSLRDETSIHSLYTLEKLLSHPLSLYNTTNILLVKASNGAILHFAPAMLAHLPETKAFMDSFNTLLSGSKTDPVVQSIHSICPHPELISLTSSNSNYLLGTIYCTVLSKIIDPHNVLQDEDSLESPDTPTLLKLNISNNSPKQSNRNNNTTHLTKHTTISSSNSNNNNSSSSGSSSTPVSTAPVYMMPLSLECLNALYKYHFNNKATNNNNGITQIVDNNNNSQNANNNSNNNACIFNSLHLLPDHARLRSSYTSNLSIDNQYNSNIYNNNNNNSHSNTSSKALRCKYILLPNEVLDIIPTNQVHNNSDTTTPLKNPRSNSSNSSSSSISSYYLVQVYDENENNSSIYTAANGGAKNAIENHSATRSIHQQLNSEFDEDFSNTFDVTDINADTNFLSTMDITKLYHQEDILLKSIVKDYYKEYMKQMNMIIIPTTTNNSNNSSNNNNSDNNTSCKKEKQSTVTTTRQSSPRNARNILEQEDDADMTSNNNSNINNNIDNINSKDNTNTKRKWDPLILSTICRWRSCMCESSSTIITPSNTNNNYNSNNIKANNHNKQALCRYHLEMKLFFDTIAIKNGNGISEAIKYLPRKAPIFNNTPATTNANNTTNVDYLSDKKKDILTIRAASSLLQELWDGKLRTTIRSFTKKVLKDMSPRIFLEDAYDIFIKAYPIYLQYLKNHNNSNNSNNSNNNIEQSKNKRNQIPMLTNNISKQKNPFIINIVNNKDQFSIIPPRPTWIIWQNKEYLEKTLQGQHQSLAILNTILLTEKAITKELELLLELKIYPSIELQLIKKDIKTFKEHQELILNKANNGEKSKHYNQNESLSTLSNGYDNLVMILTSENRLCERKLNIFNNKRYEEEEKRIITMKKIARLKAIEELEGLDPANFKNQKKF